MKLCSETILLIKVFTSGLEVNRGSEYKGKIEKRSIKLEISLSLNSSINIIITSLY